MKTKYLAILFAANAVFVALSVAALVLFATHAQFRRTVGHDQPAFDRFVAKVEGGNLQPATMTQFTNNWFTSLKQDHQVIQMEEQISDRMAGRLLFLGAIGLLTGLLQAWMIFAVWKNLRMANMPKHF